MPAWVWNRLRPWHFRGKRRLTERWGPRAGSRRVRLFGAWFELDLSDAIQRRMYTGTHETLECRAVRALLRPGMTVVDAGANAGLYTALAAACVGATGRVVAYEPAPAMAARLRRLIERNRMARVQLVEAALAGQDGAATLYGDALVASEATAVTVATCTLDEEAERLNLRFIDLLKLDVEGYEPHVLAGTHKLLAQGRIGAILCEFREPELRAAGSSIAELQRMIEQAGFEPDPVLPPRADNRLFRRKMNPGQQP